MAYNQKPFSGFGNGSPLHDHEKDEAGNVIQHDDEKGSFNISESLKSARKRSLEEKKAKPEKGSFNISESLRSARKRSLEEKKGGKAK